MSAESIYRSGGTRAWLAMLALSVQAPALWAADAPGSLLPFAGETIGLTSEPNQARLDDTAAFPMIVEPDAGLIFDLGGSDTRKLQLMLDQPLSLTTGSEVRGFEAGDMLGLDATLAVPLSSGLSIEVGADRRLTNSHFHSLGSIHCVNGTLRADSYTASGCRFINDDPLSADQQQFSLGARLDLRHASASVNWFGRETDNHLAGPNSPLAVTSTGLLSPNLANPLLSTATPDPLSLLNSEASGVDLNFQVGLTTDTHGDVRLGLAFSRVLDANFDGLYAQGPEAYSWTLAEPFNSARMNLEWSKGPFSTGIQGYYRDSVDFLDRAALDSFTTFDVHFTWRTPWNANFSVGASNVLSAGADGSNATDAQPTDPLEPIYGRIPYVRYKQDL